MSLPTTFGPAFVPGGPVTKFVEYFDDFVTGGNATATGPAFSSTADAAAWLTSLTTSAVPQVADNTDIKALTPYGAGGVVKVINAGTNNDGVSMQLNGEPFVIAPNKFLAFEGRFATSALAGTLFAFGLGKTNTAILAASGGLTFTATDFIGFTVRGTSGLILPVVKGANTETLPTIISSAAPAFVNNTWCTLRCEITYSRTTSTYLAEFYVNSILVARHSSATAALPLDSTNSTPIGLTPSVQFKTQASTAHNGFIDYIWVAQQRSSI
jgi:hypothetical protein